MTAAFATIADLRARFAERELVQLTDDAGTGAVDLGRVEQALASASAIVSGYVSATYALDPAQPVPLVLVDAACDIARHRLHRLSPPEDVRDRHAQAMKLLQGIRSGAVKLDGGVEAIPPRTGKVIVQSGDRVFTRDGLRGF